MTQQRRQHKTMTFRINLGSAVSELFVPFSGVTLAIVGAFLLITFSTKVQFYFIVMFLVYY